MEGRAEYQAFQAKVDAFELRVQAAQGHNLKCGLGCDSCCLVRRTAFAVELDYIRRWLSEQPQALRDALSARRRQAEVIAAGQRCVYLSEDGRCDIYPARPLLCRTHGPALKVEGTLVWCEKNYVGLTVDDVLTLVPENAVANLDLINAVLSLINTRFCANFSGPSRDELGAALD